MIEPKPLNPSEVSIYTVVARICRDGRIHGGASYCEKYCKHQCEWGLEYIKRLSEPAGSRPKKKQTNREPDMMDPGQIPYFPDWLADHLIVSKCSKRKFAMSAGISQACVSDNISRKKCSRFFERKAMKALGMDEDEVRERIAIWMRKNNIRN